MSIFFSRKIPNITPIFDPDLCDREFKSHLVLSEDLLSWIELNKYQFDDEFKIFERKFVQIEFFLYTVELISMSSAKRHRVYDYLAKNNEAEMVDIIRNNPSMQWRELIRKAIQDGELLCYDLLSRLPVKSSARPLSADPADVSTQDAMQESANAKSQVEALKIQLGDAQRSIDELRRLVGDESGIAVHNTHLMKIALDVQRRYWKAADRSAGKQEVIIDYLINELGLSRPEAVAVERVACPIDRSR